MREFLLENDEMLDNNKNKIPFLLSVHHLVAEGGLALKKCLCHLFISSLPTFDIHYHSI